MHIMETAGAAGAVAAAVQTQEIQSGRLIAAALIGLALLLFLIIKAKLQAMIAIIISAVAIGVMGGMPLADIIQSVNTGIGNTLKGIALLVGLGSMFGAILEISGGAQRIALTLVNRFGDDKAAWALGITGLVIAMPVFFDAGLIILIPLAFSLAKKTKRSTLYYAIPLLAGLAVGHAFIPPTPGPILVATMLGVDLGWVIMVGVLCGTAAMIIAGPVFGRYIGNKIFVALPSNVSENADYDESKLPSFGMVVGIILIPLFLIVLNTVSGAVPALAGVQPFFAFIGEPFMALTIATVAAMIMLGVKRGYSWEELEKVMTKSLEPTGMILLVTACGGVLRYVLQDSGLGEIIGTAVSSASLPIVIIAFVVAALVRVSVGSATVAMTMAAGIVAAMPGIASLSQLHLACITAAVAGGATVMSHFNDSGFWLVKSLLQIDEKTTLKSWTIMETLVGGSGFVVALLISMFA
ncbi:MAG: gluconate:H+ symporter [Lachnospiraceae bacterium]|nr:gluconate:H+ symporter [Lachnospiraceae bacterium]